MLCDSIFSDFVGCVFPWGDFITTPQCCLYLLAHWLYATFSTLAASRFMPCFFSANESDWRQVVHVSSDQNHAWLAYRRDYTTHFYEDYFISHEITIPKKTKQNSMVHVMVPGFVDVTHVFCTRTTFTFASCSCQVFLMFVWLGCSVWGLFV